MVNGTLPGNKGTRVPVAPVLPWGDFMAKLKYERKTINDGGGNAKAKRAPKGKGRYDMDRVVSGFGIRVTDKGHRSYILVARYPGSSNPTRRAIGDVGSIELADARQK